MQPMIPITRTSRPGRVRISVDDDMVTYISDMSGVRAIQGQIVQRFAEPEHVEILERWFRQVMDPAVFKAIESPTFSTELKLPQIQTEFENFRGNLRFQ